ncbi:nuclease [Chitinispirillum alkaliphilum]|nr:nuclease [Chitinispirillum alkaliphilum]
MCYLKFQPIPRKTVRLLLRGGMVFLKIKLGFCAVRSWRKIINQLGILYFMDFTPFIKQITSILWWIIPLVIVITILKSSWFKGLMGEFIINVSAKWLLDKNQYHLIKNVTLPTSDGTTQIDHIIASKFGVFVVETKNMKGWIYGSQNQKTWTQKIYRYSAKFQNPLHQNYKHVKVLESLLGLNEKQLHSVVIFIGDCTIKTEMPENVTHGLGYLWYIKSKTEPVLTKSQVNQITRKIESGRLSPSLKTNLAHIRHVKTIVEEKKNTPNCPKCGGVMVMRKAKRGQNVGKEFWGCVRFPQCRGVVDVV